MSGGFGSGALGTMPCGTSSMASVPSDPIVNIDATSPSVGIAIRRLQHVLIDLDIAVADLSTLDITAAFMDGTADVVWDGEAFTELYVRGSSFAAHGDGTRFVLRRQGGWRSARVRIRVD